MKTALRAWVAVLLMVLGVAAARRGRRLYAGEPARSWSSRAASSTRRPIRKAAAPLRSGNPTPAGATARRAAPGRWNIASARPTPTPAGRISTPATGRASALAAAFRPARCSAFSTSSPWLVRDGRKRRRLVSRPDVRKARRPVPLQRHRLPPARAAAAQHHAGATGHGDGSRHHVVPRRRTQPVDRLARPDRRHLRHLPDPDRGPRRPPDRSRLRRPDHLARRRHLRGRLRRLCVCRRRRWRSWSPPPSWAPAISC